VPKYVCSRRQVAGDGALKIIQVAVVWCGGRQRVLVNVDVTSRFDMLQCRSRTGWSDFQL
jgi:hypothetical protein